MGRAPCCEKKGLKKGPWTTEEDFKLTQYIERHGPGNWRTLPKNAGLERCGKSCRLRWTNYLRPDIKRGRFSFEEEETIIQLHSLLGNKWSAIAARLPGRTDNEIKNYWNTQIRKRLLRMGLDPVTHTPKFSTTSSGAEQLNILSNLLLAISQSQVQQLVNPQLLSIVSSLMTLNQQTGLQNHNISNILQNCTNWEPNIIDQYQYQCNNNNNNNFNDGPSLNHLEQQLNNDVLQPNDNNSVEGCFGAEMGGYGFDQQQVVQGQQMQFNPLSYDKQMSFNNSVSSASSPLKSSSGNNNGVSNVDDCTSFFNFEIPEGFDMSSLL